ncbi:LuxR family transcriptional regulator [Isoptericola hypogeus]|uniref:LuxR family transcriptional regulator n=1 Tax=Isoptericola hypogeus TaxID=300179 RepID=A0ABP4VL49_9MICO
MATERVSPDVVRPEFVGRARELAQVAWALDGGRAHVTLEGEAGIGKSRLVQEALAVSPRHVLWMTCPPLAEPFPLGPVIDGLRRSVDDVAGLGLSVVAGALRPLLPEWAHALPPAPEPLRSAGANRHRVLRALVELLDATGVDTIVVEDAHWADAATLDLLLTLASAPGPGPSLVLTYRDGEVPQGSPLRRVTARAPAGARVCRLTLGPLSVAETGQLVGSMFGGADVSPQFASFLDERTDGVPLAVEEMARLLADRRHIVRSQDLLAAGRDELEVPPTVRDSVLERVDRLGSAARRVLEAAAVLAAPSTETELAEVAGISPAAARPGLATALAVGLVREAGPGRYDYRHVLDAQAVAGSVPASTWRHLHARASRVVERTAPDAVERLSRHSREAGETERWCRFAEAGADVALQAGADRGAVVQLLRVLTQAEHPPERLCRLAGKLGAASFFSVSSLGDLMDDVVVALRGVVDDPRISPSERGPVRVWLARNLWQAGRQQEAFGAFAAAMPDLDDDPDLALTVAANLAMPVVPEWPAERHLAWLDRGRALAAEARDAQSVAFRGARASALLLLGHEEGWALVADLESAAATLEPSERPVRHALAAGMLNVAGAALVWGRYDDARRMLDVVAELEAPPQRLIDGITTCRAYLAWFTGRWSGLEDTVRQVAESETSWPRELLAARQLRGLLRLASGHRVAAVKDLDAVTGQYVRLGIVEPLAIPPVVALGRIALADGDAPAALRTTSPWVEAISRKGIGMWLGDLAPVHVEALLAVGRHDEAARVVEQLAAGVEGRRAPGPAAALAACRGLLADADGEHDRAAERHGSAAAAWAGVQRRYDAELARERSAHSLMRAGRRDDGLAVLTDVETRLRELGAAWDTDRVARDLRGLGVDVVRTWRRGRKGYGNRLSPREVDALGLVARGMTNREVAEVLFLSPRTVARHLGSAMRKLDVTSRTAAAMAAREAGLLDDVVG